MAAAGEENASAQVRMFIDCSFSMHFGMHCNVQQIQQLTGENCQLNAFSAEQRCADGPEPYVV
jgi:hypothetical protein